MVTNLDVLPILKVIIIKNADSILDVGCGGTTYDRETRSHDWWNFFMQKKRVGIDIWKPEILWRRNHFPNDTFYVMDAIDIDKVFAQKSFDIVHCQNVIEHLEKSDAVELIKKLEAIAKKQVILGTPKGFRQTGALRGNIYETHICEFKKEELEGFGYNVIEIGDYFLCYKNFGEKDEKA